MSRRANGKPERVPPSEDAASARQELPRFDSATALEPSFAEGLADDDARRYLRAVTTLRQSGLPRDPREELPSEPPGSARASALAARCFERLERFLDRARPGWSDDAALV